MGRGGVRLSPPRPPSPVRSSLRGRAGGRGDPRPGAGAAARGTGPRATYPHGVGEVELLGRTTELLPGLELRHRGPAAEPDREARPRPERRDPAHLPSYLPPPPPPDTRAQPTKVVATSHQRLVSLDSP